MYAELHCHSGFSLLDGASNPEDLIARAAAIGISSVALTDHDDLGGVVRWAEAGLEHGVATIIGVEVTVANGERAVRVCQRMANPVTLEEEDGATSGGLHARRRAPCERSEPSDRPSARGAP
jgi:DNA polymerase III alpha subunit